MPLRWSKEQYQDFLDNRAGQIRELKETLEATTGHKYKAQPVEVYGIRFDSKLEARYYERLLERQAAGEIVGFLRQVPFHLPGRTKLVIDFLEFRSDGSAVFVDTKGFETEVFKVKLRQARELYPWAQIEIVRRVS